MRHFTFTTLPICAVLFFLGTWLVSAGDLTPPSGPPAPTGRFGPRIDVNTLPGDADSIHRITAPGSYYLSANVIGADGFHGIEILANDVTLDLNGFRLVGTPGGSLNGIHAEGIGIRVLNGAVSLWGGVGVRVYGANSSVTDVRATQCGSWGFDVSQFDSTILDKCQAHGNGGLVASGGFRLGAGASVTNCIARQNVGAGFEAVSYCLITDCHSVINSGIGIDVGEECLLNGNLSRFNGGGNTTAVPATSTLVNNRF